MPWRENDVTRRQYLAGPGLAGWAPGWLAKYLVTAETAVGVVGSSHSDYEQRFH